MFDGRWANFHILNRSDELDSEPLSISPFEEAQWIGGATPHSVRFGDCYFTSCNGLAESRHVFLQGNDLPARFRHDFQIAELGFGTGLNALAALLSWRTQGISGRFRFTAFEAYPLSADDMRRSWRPFAEIERLGEPIALAWERGQRVITLPDFVLEVVIGDARVTVPRWTGVADAWFLDGFAPSRNPELWEPKLLAAVESKTAPNGSFATYSAAGEVRRILTSLGFKVERKPGFGRKRHMSCGRCRRA